MIKHCKVCACFFLILGLLLNMLTACSNTESKNNASKKSKADMAADAQNPRSTIQYTQWSIPSAKLVEDAISRFNETNGDNIHAEVLKIPLDRYMETLNMLNAAGTGPDVYELLQEWVESYVSKGWAAELSKYADDSFMGAFPSWTLHYVKTFRDMNGRIYTMPSNQITFRLIYNKELFSEAGLSPDTPPGTLSELETYAKKISDAEIGKRKYGFAMPMGEEWMDFVRPMEASNCLSGVYFYNFKEGKYDLTVYMPWLETIKKLKENGSLFPGSDTMKSSQAMAQFADGNIGMMYASSWEISMRLSKFTPKCAGGAALTPPIDASKAGKGAAEIDLAGWNVVNAQSTHLEEAAELWKFLYSYDYLSKLSQNGLMIPLRTDVSPEAGVLNTTPAFRRFLPGKFDSVYPFTPMYMEEWARKNLYLEVLAGNENSQELLVENDRLNALLKAEAYKRLINMDDYLDPHFDMLNPLKK